MFTSKYPKIYFEKGGKGKPLILLHGNKEDHHIFDDLVEVLKEDYTLYCVDARGHGQSEKVQAYHYDDMANDIIGLIEEEKIENPAFYGFSDGAIVGIICAVKRPDLFSKLILSGANVTVKGLKPSVLLGMKLSYFFTRDKRTAMMLKEPNITAEQLQRIQSDTLVIAGEFDIIRQKETEFIADNIPDSVLRIIDGKSHGDYIVHKTYMADIIRDFVQ